MAYAVVEFNDNNGGGVAAVNSAWFTPLKRECFWPPYKEQNKFDKALRLGEAVDHDTWKLYEICRIFYTTDDLLKAREKLKQAQVTSNLESEEENEGGYRKRRKIVKKIISSDDEEIEGPRQSFIPRPPAIKRVYAKSSINFGRSQKDFNEDCSGTQSYQNTNYCGGGSSGASNNNSTNDNFYLLEKIERLTTLVATVKEQNDNILELLSQQCNQRLSVVQDLPNIPFTLPLKTVQEVDQLDGYLKEHNAHYEGLLFYLGGFGGNHIANVTNRIIKFILCDTAVLQFNYYGKRSDKRAFCDLVLRKLVIGSVKRTISNATDKELEDAIKVWLKHAQDRLKKHGRKN